MCGGWAPSMASGKFWGWGFWGPSPYVWIYLTCGFHLAPPGGFCPLWLKYHLRHLQLSDSGENSGVVGLPPSTSQLPKSRCQLFAAWPQPPLQSPPLLTSPRRSNSLCPWEEGPARGREHCTGIVLLTGFSVSHSTSQQPVILEWLFLLKMKFFSS